MQPIPPSPPRPPSSNSNSAISKRSGVVDYDGGDGSGREVPVILAAPSNFLLVSRPRLPPITTWWREDSISNNPQASPFERSVVVENALPSIAEILERSRQTSHALTYPTRAHQSVEHSRLMRDYFQTERRVDATTKSTTTMYEGIVYRFQERSATLPSSPQLPVLIPISDIPTANAVVQKNLVKKGVSSRPSLPLLQPSSSALVTQDRISRRFSQNWYIHPEPKIGPASISSAASEFPRSSPSFSRSSNRPGSLTSERRTTQNRLAQRASRQRREQHVRFVAARSQLYEKARYTFHKLMTRLKEAKEELRSLKQSETTTPSHTSLSITGIEGEGEVGVEEEGEIYLDSVIDEELKDQIRQDYQLVQRQLKAGRSTGGISFSEEDEIWLFKS